MTHADDLALAQRLADAADALTLARFRAQDLHVDAKPDLTPVSDADLAVETEVRRLLAEARPADAVLGEEHGSTGEGPRQWVIDPIDGTKNFVRGIPVWATLIALLVEDRVEVGVVSAPALGRRWWAARGSGAFADGQPIRVSSVRALSDAQLSYSSLEGWREQGRLDGLLDLASRCWRTRAFGDFWSHVLVAEGAVDASFEPEVSLWDLAPLQVIVEEAGGRFSSLDGTAKPDGGSVVCSNGLLHEEVLTGARAEVSPRGAGVLLAVASAVSFGVMPVLTKVTYDDGADVEGVLSLRFSVAAVLLLVLARLRGESLARGRQLVVLLLLGGVGYVTESACYFAALTRISAGLTALLLYLYPAIVVLLTALVTRRRPSARAAVCVLVATLGTGLTIGPVGGGQVTGVVLGLTAALTYAGYIVVSSRIVRPGSPFATSAVVMGGAALVYDVGAVSFGASLPSSAGAWTALLAVALVCTVLAVSTFFAALPRLGPADLAVLSTIEPVVSVGVGALALGESLGPVQLVGGLLVLAAVAVLARTPPEVPLDAP